MADDCGDPQAKGGSAFEFAGETVLGNKIDNGRDWAL